MPIYEYRCDQGHTFDVRQRIADDPVRICETCGAPVARVLHPVAVHFKGSGFYNTDYGKRKRGAGENGDGGGEEGSKGGGSEAKGSEGKGSETTKPDGASGDGANKKAESSKAASSSGSSGE